MTLESEAPVWADALLVVEVVLTETPTPAQMKRFARLWPDIQGSLYGELRVSYANENNGAVPILDDDQVAIRCAFAAPTTLGLAPRQRQAGPGHAAACPLAWQPDLGPAETSASGACQQTMDSQPSGSLVFYRARFAAGTSRPTFSERCASAPSVERRVWLHRSHARSRAK